MSYYHQVKEFHKTFGLLVEDSPKQPSLEVLEFRTTLIEEEYLELIEAIMKGDLAEIAKEAADLHYVVSGLCVSLGIPEERVFAEVHRSNMSKALPDGTVMRRSDGKILKPASYSPADVQKVFDEI